MKKAYSILLPALTLQFIGALLYFIILADQSFSKYIYLVTKILLIILPLLFIKQIDRKKFPLFSKPNRRTLNYSITSALVLILGTLAIYSISPEFWSTFTPNLIKSAENLGILNHYIIFALFLSIAHSFIEEYYWRWFVGSELTKITTENKAATISAIAFASHHFLVILAFSNVYFAILGTIVIFALGFLWSKEYFKTKSLFNPWISHFFADISVMAIGYLLIF